MGNQADMHDVQYNRENGDREADRQGLDRRSRAAELLRRVILAALATVMIISLLFNLAGISEWKVPFVRSDVGLPESEIIARYGEPQERSRVQAKDNRNSVGSGPRRLDESERYYSLTYEQGLFVIVFIFVSPDTYRKYNAYQSGGQEWVVFERFIGTKRVNY